MFDDTTSYGLLKTLADEPYLSQRDLAKRLGVSLGKVNFCLNALIAKGCLKADNFRNSDNKLAYVYLLTPRGVEQKAHLTVEFLQIKIREYERLRVEIAELRQSVEQHGATKIKINEREGIPV
ncbi:MAG: MarR family EPS-associated transcriptional regulator [Gallionella sp.]|nr:MarR family EPS-associated transcriptional regulator [Gallionella sp.]